MTTIDKPAAFQGKGKYIFVSYSHQDDDFAYPFIIELQKKYNVWFDEGISSGSEWNKMIADKIIGCAFFIFIVSRNSLSSEYCINEIHLAEKYKKLSKGKFLSFCLVDRDYRISPWYDLMTLKLQHFYYHDYPNISSAISKIEKDLPRVFKQVKSSEVKNGKDKNDVKKSDLLICPICFQTFGDKNAFDRHLVDMHSGSEKATNTSKETKQYKETDNKKAQAKVSSAADKWQSFHDAFIDLIECQDKMTTKWLINDQRRYNTLTQEAEKAKDLLNSKPKPSIANLLSIYFKMRINTISFLAFMFNRPEGLTKDFFLNMAKKDQDCIKALFKQYYLKQSSSPLKGNSFLPGYDKPDILYKKLNTMYLAADFSPAAVTVVYQNYLKYCISVVI